MRRGSTKVQEPTNAEELRHRLRVWKNAMVTISLKHSKRHELQGAWEETVELSGIQGLLIGRVCVWAHPFASPQGS